MGIFKKIGQYAAIGIGTAGLAIGGWSGVHFKHEVKGFDSNYHVIKEKAGIVAVVGDPGLMSKQRSAVFADLKALCFEAMESGQNFNTIHNGDLEYPNGTTDDNGHDAYIKSLWPLCPAHRHAIIQLGNHGLLAFKGQSYMAKRYHGKPVSPGIVMPNYYAALEFEDQLFLLNESTIYDAWLDPAIESRQEAFDDAVLKKSYSIPVNYVAHHPFYTPSKRKPTKDYLRFYNKHLKGKISRVLAAHDHLAWESYVDGIYHSVSGMGAKTTMGPLAYVVISPSGTGLRHVTGGEITKAEEDEE